MYDIHFDHPVWVHFIGIGGISMSGLAEILHDRGFKVSGSDMKASPLTEHLESLGISVQFPQKSENIVPGIELCVYTAAISEDNPEFQEVKRQNIPMMSRAELLGRIMKNYKEAINVSGTHGKTTTTSMIGEILMEAQMDPTITVGGMMKDIGGNLRVGKSDVFLAEACEYTNSFLSFFPTIEVVLNVEEDHLDFFKDINDIRASFRKFIEKLPENGILIFNKDIPHAEFFLEDLPGRKIITFGHQDADYTANFISYDHFARPSFTLFENGEDRGRVTLGVTGEHNIYNSLSAIAVARAIGIPFETIKKGLMEFSGTDRRFQLKGEVNGFTIIDDYAHHPQEIAATIATAKKYPHKKLWVAFQPHTYSRTLALMDDFAGALSQADEIILADIYAAREKNTVGVTSDDLRKLMLSQNTNVYYIPDFPSIEEFILSHLQEGDLLITMGAGDIVEVGEHLLQIPGAKKE
ncbi:UDP-N-acetylmuramate-alanine ligase [Oribacterium parvum ACB1]|jgi:UDP-N-acetylmuramate--L-alanine ligase|uniref:UDP-N-acetylmuramate--L-alanine ligase n=1 Tax=Oribacterium parvum ACB1 TaxID=796943 RepID=G9WPW5_9FIRM|nr:UDP-N-acetylmuramate--L-alanine ligase [Oribacterium parvum]EHL10398.1 UDP-N-acetylmuramate-alanine ligase [Oribacterium parvum ACB1]EJF12295.1 UDP-N-acetylmuramate--L-alanine ligase [Oribacterium parvum ACB8]